MEYKYLENIFNTEEIVLPQSEKIDPFLIKNHNADIFKAIDFFNSDERILYIHGFLGTGKRQLINYITEFFNKDVITLEYYCKQSTVCDDILISFIDILEKNSLAKAVNQNAKITTLAIKFQQYISSIKKPFVIILHSYDDIAKENIELVSNCIKNVLNNSNIKLIFSTRAMLRNVFGDVKIGKKIFLRALTKDIFKELLKFHSIKGTDDATEDFYKYSRGYYYYTILSIKIMLAMNLTLNDFLHKYTLSGMSFDSYLGFTYINLIPNTIQNFFWFLSIIRHGISVNALAILGLYDEYSINYLKNNLMIYQSGEVVYVQDYFQQDIDISIPAKTEIKLRKYIINIYEKELKESLQTRSILISRQALRAEIEYHKQKINELESPKNKAIENIAEQKETTQTEGPQITHDDSKKDINQKMSNAKKMASEKKYTEAIESYLNIIDDEKPDKNTLAEIRVELGRLYRSIDDFEKSKHYYETAEKYYKNQDEFINLNYLYYELTSLYFDMYKIDRAVDTIKKVIYSVDTPSSLMIDSCILLGNIYSETKNYKEASKYYQKALESIDDDYQGDGKSELYFKYALMCDENDDSNSAFEYYNKCITLNENNQYKSLAYSNLGSCYFENDNYSDAEACFIKAYEIEKNNNNYDGIYYTSSYLAKIYIKLNPKKALDYLKEAKQAAEFLNEDFYIIEATVALGDYYYNHKEQKENALQEYFKAKKVAANYGNTVDLTKIEERINDMKHRLEESNFRQIEKSYDR